LELQLRTAGNLMSGLEVDSNYIRRIRNEGYTRRGSRKWQSNGGETLVLNAKVLPAFNWAPTEFPALLESRI
jgi:hypothetical protein